jgi:hypothetical protein
MVNLSMMKTVAKFTLVNAKNTVQSSFKTQFAHPTVPSKLLKPLPDADVHKNNVFAHHKNVLMKVKTTQSDTNGTKTTTFACHAVVMTTVKPLVKISEPSDNAAVSIKIMFVQKDNSLFTKKNFLLLVANTTLVNVSESNVKKSSQNIIHTDFAKLVTNQKPKLLTNVVLNKLVFAILNNADY